MADRNLTFLIVHGAWTGGWSWERVLNRLQPESTAPMRRR
ncbi:Hypothetical protein NGAL_HAMBI2610_47310 [Neorhizobium galegae bv. orientalis]|nr:Hypothetical protein NGAL_HAMBI2610_47310 [Neorhizobium galegae bv. orientalis]